MRGRAAVGSKKGNETLERFPSRIINKTQVKTPSSFDKINNNYEPPTLEETRKCGGGVTVQDNTQASSENGSLQPLIEEEEDDISQTVEQNSNFPSPNSASTTSSLSQDSRNIGTYRVKTSCRKGQVKPLKIEPVEVEGSKVEPEGSKEPEPEDPTEANSLVTPKKSKRRPLIPESFLLAIRQSFASAFKQTNDSFKDACKYAFSQHSDSSDSETEEESKLMERELPVRVMRLAGLPLKVTHRIYREARDEVNVLHDLSLGTLQTVYTVVKWMLGQKNGREEFVRVTRSFCSIHGEVDTQSRAWENFQLTAFPKLARTISVACVQTAISQETSLFKPNTKSQKSITDINYVTLMETTSKSPPTAEASGNSKRKPTGSEYDMRRRQKLHERRQELMCRKPSVQTWAKHNNKTTNNNKNNNNTINETTTDSETDSDHPKFTVDSTESYELYLKNHLPRAQYRAYRNAVHKFREEVGRYAAKHPLLPPTSVSFADFSDPSGDSDFLARALESQGMGHSDLDSSCLEAATEDSEGYSTSRQTHPHLPLDNDTLDENECNTPVANLPEIKPTVNSSISRKPPSKVKMAARSHSRILIERKDGNNNSVIMTKPATVGGQPGGGGKGPSRVAIPRPGPPIYTAKSMSKNSLRKSLKEAEENNNGGVVGGPSSDPIPMSITAPAISKTVLEALTAAGAKYNKKTGLKQKGKSAVRFSVGATKDNDDSLASSTTASTTTGATIRNSMGDHPPVARRGAKLRAPKNPSTGSESVSSKHLPNQISDLHNYFEKRREAKVPLGGSKSKESVMSDNLFGPALQAAFAPSPKSRLGQKKSLDLETAENAGGKRKGRVKRTRKPDLSPFGGRISEKKRKAKMDESEEVTDPIEEEEEEEEEEEMRTAPPNSALYFDLNSQEATVFEQLIKMQTHMHDICTGLQNLNNSQ